MNPWRPLIQIAFLVTAAASVLGQSQNPLPGSPTKGVGGGLGTRAPANSGGGNSFSVIPLRGAETVRYDPSSDDLIMGINEAQREKLVLYFTAQFQKKNVADTNRLVTLARELSVASDKTGRVPTSAEVKKVEEIAKLAKRVRERLTAP